MTSPDLPEEQQQLPQGGGPQQGLAGPTLEQFQQLMANFTALQAEHAQLAAQFAQAPTPTQANAPAPADAAASPMHRQPSFEAIEPDSENQDPQSIQPLQDLAKALKKEFSGSNPVFEWSKTMPKFKGDNKIPIHLFFDKAEYDLENKKVPGDKWRKHIVMGLFEDGASTWYNGFAAQRTAEPSYSEFKQAALAHFTKNIDRDTILKPFKHKTLVQRGSTSSYIEAYKEARAKVLAHPDPEVSAYYSIQHYIDFFKDGLDPGTRAVLTTRRYQGAAGLEQFYQDAQDVGDSLWEEKQKQNRTPNPNRIRKPPGTPVRQQQQFEAVLSALNALLQKPNGDALAALQNHQQPLGKAQQIPEKYRNLPPLTPELRQKCIAENRCFRCREIMGTSSHPGRSSNQCSIFTSAPKTGPRLNNIEKGHQSPRSDTDEEELQEPGKD